MCFQNEVEMCRQEVEYLGHIPKLAQSVEDFPIPKNVDNFLACARTTDGPVRSSQYAD